LQLEYQLRIAYARAKIPIQLPSGQIFDHIGWQRSLESLYPHVHNWNPWELLDQSLDKNYHGRGCPLAYLADNGLHHWVKDKFWVNGSNYDEKVRNMIYFLKMRIPVIVVITMTRDYPLNAYTPYLGVGKPLYGRVASDREATHAVVIVGHYIAKPNDPYKLKAGTTYFLYQDSFQAGKLVSNQSLFGNQINILHPDVVIEGYCGVSHIPNVLMTLEEAKEKKNLKHSRVDVKQTRTKEVDYCRTYHKNLE
jgi:hypothetical protein